MMDKPTRIEVLQAVSHRLANHDIDTTPSLWDKLDWLFYLAESMHDESGHDYPGTPEILMSYALDELNGISSLIMNHTYAPGFVDDKLRVISTLSYLVHTMSRAGIIPATHVFRNITHWLEGPFALYCEQDYGLDLYEIIFGTSEDAYTAMYQNFDEACNMAKAYSEDAPCFIAIFAADEDDGYAPTGQPLAMFYRGDRLLIDKRTLRS